MIEIRVYDYAEPRERERARLFREVAILRREIAENFDSAAHAELAAALERAETALENLR